MQTHSVFISYSHKDEEWKDRLVTHLSILELEGILDIWDDRRIEAGDDWRSEIEEAIYKATIAILLISANFLTSKFILGQEVPKLLERREKEGVRVIPIIIKPCTWTRVSWLSKLQARPKDGKAISSGNENQIDFDFASISEEIAHLLESFHEINSPTTVKPNKLKSEPSKLHQDKVKNLERRILHLIDFGDYQRAINECNDFLAYNSSDPLINLLIVIATLKGKGADRYQTKTITRLEKHLIFACDDPMYYPTALVIWALIKHDHYRLNGLYQAKPTLEDMKERLTKTDFEEIDLELVGKIKASQSAYKYLNLLRYFGG